CPPPPQRPPLPATSRVSCWGPAGWWARCSARDSGRWHGCAAPSPSTPPDRSAPPSSRSRRRHRSSAYRCCPPPPGTSAWCAGRARPACRHRYRTSRASPSASRTAGTAVPPTCCSPARAEDGGRVTPSCSAARTRTDPCRRCCRSSARPARCCSSSSPGTTKTLPCAGGSRSPRPAVTGAPWARSRSCGDPTSRSASTRCCTRSRGPGTTHCWRRSVSRRTPQPGPVQPPGRP
ncbi:MAG: putative phosphodiesterase, partial [uncultured Nocardioidaceae bacterium]